MQEVDEPVASPTPLVLETVPPTVTVTATRTRPLPPFLADPTSTLPSDDLDALLEDRGVELDEARDEAVRRGQQKDLHNAREAYYDGTWAEQVEELDDRLLVLYNSIRNKTWTKGHSAAAGELDEILLMYIGIQEELDQWK